MHLYSCTGGESPKHKKANGTFQIKKGSPEMVQTVQAGKAQLEREFTIKRAASLFNITKQFFNPRF